VGITSELASHLSAYPVWHLMHVANACYDTCMSKLTLNVDAAVVERAKRVAEELGTSVSALVEGYLDQLTRPPVPADAPPILRRLRGVLSGTDITEHRRHLEQKYR
jgi:hypothetical protein